MQVTFLTVLLIGVNICLAKNPGITKFDSTGFAEHSINAKNIGTDLNYRLPNNTYPEHYDIEITTNVHTGERSFQGKVVIDTVIANTSANIVLHARELEISEVFIENTSTGESEPLSYEYESEREFLTLTREGTTPFAANTNWKLAITYTGNLRDDLEGFFLSEYVDDENKTHYFASTFFSSTNARYAFPCYDEPDKRANFTITINHSPNYNATSNMPVNAALCSPGKTVFLTTDRLPTYIIAFVVSDFEYSEITLNGFTQRLYSRPNAKSTHQLGLSYAAPLLDELTKYFGVPLIIPKIDHLAVPYFNAEAMENWGLIIYSELSLLCNDNASNSNAKTKVGLVIAHELAHHWLGDYVTLKWWTYVWLKEGAATLFSYKALDKIYPQWDIWQRFHIRTYQRLLEEEGEGVPRPLTSYVQKPTEISSVFDRISYHKGACVLHMWNNALTENIFQKSYSNFLRQNQYSAVEEHQLFSAFQRTIEDENYELPARISDMIGTWSHQGGYPLLTVTRDYENGTFTVKQEAFHNDENIKESKTWYVPINYAVASQPDFHDTKATHYLMNVSETTVHDVNISRGDWLMLNKQSTGYYRINYDTKNWNLIADSLIERPLAFHYRNRAQFIDDSFHLSASNRLDHATHLKLLSYLKTESKYASWYTANTILQKYIGSLKDHKQYDDFKFFVVEQVNPIYQKLGVDEIPGENHNDKLIRRIVIDLACEVGVPECLEDTNRKLKDYLHNHIPMDPSLRFSIIYNGLRQCSDDIFNRVLRKLLTSKIHSPLLPNDLSYSENEEQIKKLIYSTIDMSNALRPRERYHLLSYVYSKGGTGFLACIKFLEEKWHSYSMIKKDSIKDILQMASYVRNKNQEKQLLALVTKLRNKKYVTPSLEADVFHIIMKSNEWLRQHGEPIMSWMSQYRSSRAISSV